MDGTSKGTLIDLTTQASDLLDTMAERVNLDDAQGWGIFENNTNELYMKGQSYVGDALSRWQVK